MTKRLSGKKVAEALYEEIPDMGGKYQLVIITVGEDPASEIYVCKKLEACKRINLSGTNLKFPWDATREELVNVIKKLNTEPTVIGIIIQRPYPLQLKGIDNEIDSRKDVDGLSLANLGLTLLGKLPNYYPATPFGILSILNYYRIPIPGKNIVVIGRSEIVGLPMAAMLRAHDATVTVCHSKTHGLFEHTRRADIIISAVGKADFLDETYIGRNYPVVIDVGTSRGEDGKIHGDLNPSAYKYTSAYTPPTGGVGPMTVASLMVNCRKALRLLCKI